MGEAALLSQRGPDPPALQSLGLEEVFDLSRGRQCPLCLARLAIKPVCAFEAAPRFQPLTKNPRRDHRVIEDLHADKYAHAKRGFKNNL